jgi:hypothetical protein
LSTAIEDAVNEYSSIATLSNPFDGEKFTVIVVTPDVLDRLYEMSVDPPPLSALTHAGQCVQVPAPLTLVIENPELAPLVAVATSKWPDPVADRAIAHEVPPHPVVVNVCCTSEIVAPAPCGSKRKVRTARKPNIFMLFSVTEGASDENVARTG